MPHLGSLKLAMMGVFTPQKNSKCYKSVFFLLPGCRLSFSQHPTDSNPPHFLAITDVLTTHPIPIPTPTTFNSFCFPEAGFPRRSLPNSSPPGGYCRSFSSYFSSCKGGLISLTMILNLSRKSGKVSISICNFQAWRRVYIQRSHSHVRQHSGRRAFKGGRYFSICLSYHPSLSDT